MPITTIGSYPMTLDEFTAHWDLVNLELGGDPLTDMTLEGAYTRANMIADRAAVAAAISVLEALENDLEIADGARDIQRDEMRAMLSSFRGMVRGKLGKTVYAGAPPKLPAKDASPAKFLKAFDDMADLWSKINADTTIPGFTPPLLIANGYDQPTFVSDLADLRTMLQTYTTADRDARHARKKRDALLRAARQRMVQYRILVPATFGEEHPLTLSMPDLTPSGGSTPSPVGLSGSWDATLMAAALSWTESNDPDLQEYSVRMTPGSTYDPNNHTIVAAVLPGQTTLNTNEGLATPGDSATFKVYVVRNTGNEAGSNSVTITHV